MDGVERMVQEMAQDQDRQENEAHQRFQRLEDMIRGLTVVVEKISSTRKSDSDDISVTNGVHSSSSSRWRKLDIPVFIGEDAYGWTNRLERYFRLKEVTEDERMQAVLIALEGKALNWFQWWETCNPKPTWDAFKIAVVRRFQPTMLDNPFEVLLGLKQTGQVEEYIENFEQYAGFLKNVEQDYLVGIFLNGLTEGIKAEVKLHEPKSLAELMMKAKMVEEKIRVTSKSGLTGVSSNISGAKPYSATRTFSREGSHSVASSTTNKEKGESSEVSIRNSGGLRQRGAPFRKLSDAELQDKMKKGYVLDVMRSLGLNMSVETNSCTCYYCQKTK